MNYKIFPNLLLLFIALCTSSSCYSEHGIYQGSDLYKDCKIAKDIINHSTHKYDANREEVDKALISLIACSSYIDAIYDMAVGETDLVQNKEIKNINRLNLVSTEVFHRNHNFCVPKNLTNEELVLSVENYIDSKLKMNPGDTILVLPAVDVILYSFHENFPCQL